MSTSRLPGVKGMASFAFVLGHFLSETGKSHDLFLWLWMNRTIKNLIQAISIVLLFKTEKIHTVYKKSIIIQN